MTFSTLQRGYFHFHSCVTTVLSPDILAAIAHSKVFSDLVANIYDKMIKAELPLKYHVEGAARDHYPKETKPVARNVSAVIPPLPSDPNYLDHIHTCVSLKNVHSWKHTDACVRPNCPTCRMAKGSGLCEATGSYLVTVKMLEKENHFSLAVQRVPEREPPAHDNRAPDTYNNCTLPPIEDRPICFELQRRKVPLVDKDGNSFPPGAAPDLLYWLDCAELIDDPVDKDIVEALKGIQMLEAVAYDASEQPIHDTTLPTFKHFVERRNRMVTEYVRALMAAIASNMAVYPMGTGSAAKTANM